MGYFSRGADIIVSGGVSKGYNIPWLDPNSDVLIMQNYGNGTSFGHIQLKIQDNNFSSYELMIKNNQSQTPLCIHRAPLGTHERFIGFLIEHFAGNFPLWLAPIQMVLIPISDKFNDYATSVYNMLKDNNIRVQIDKRSEKMGAKIRDAEINKIPIMIILGEKELNDKSISVRRKFEGNLGAVMLDNFIDSTLKEINNRENPKVNETV